ncbi:MAG: hypothetical protein AAF799_01475 [Myxococcota bacterium]
MCFCVEFLDNPSRLLRHRILEHMNAWSDWGHVRFCETRGIGDIRITRSGREGHWSYIGTEILFTSTSEATMNLSGFTEHTSDYELIRVVRHMTGHCLGLEHERLPQAQVACIDRQRAIEYFGRLYGWSQETVIEQVLTPLERGSLLGSSGRSHLSLMSHQVPGRITRDGRPIIGGLDIHAADGEIIAGRYPIPEGSSSDDESECCPSPPPCRPERPEHPDEPCPPPEPPPCAEGPERPDPPSGGDPHPGCRPQRPCPSRRSGFDGVLYFAAGTDPRYVADVIAAVESE